MQSVGKPGGQFANFGAVKIRFTYRVKWPTARDSATIHAAVGKSGCMPG